MATITAADVKKLRDATGAGMMDCKAALTEANGDFDEANTILRKRGMASAAKKAGRATSEGLIAHRVSADHASGVLVEVNCESDFVARTDEFQQLMENIVSAIEQAGDAANDAWLADPNGPVQMLLKPVIGKLGENMAAPRLVRYAGKGYVGQYIHLGGKIGVQVEFSGVTPEVAGRDDFAALVKEVAMQIAAASPTYVSREAVPADLLDKERADLPRADGKLRQAGERHRQNRRGQARKLLRAGCADRSAVDSRPEGDRRGRAVGRVEDPRRHHWRLAVCTSAGRRDAIISLRDRLASSGL